MSDKYPIVNFGVKCRKMLETLLFFMHFLTSGQHLMMLEVLENWLKIEENCIQSCMGHFAQIFGPISNEDCTVAHCTAHFILV